MSYQKRESDDFHNLIQFANQNKSDAEKNNQTFSINSLAESLDAYKISKEKLRWKSNQQWKKKL